MPLRKYMERIDDERILLKQGAVPGMRVPGMVYADGYIENSLEEDNSLLQVANVATLPGIVGYSFAMPDIHWGYGFPIGGVAAFSEEEGIISPGGVGYDISCGVRLLSSRIPEQEVRKAVDSLLPALFSAVPSGAVSGGGMELSKRELDTVLENGAEWAVKKGFGSKEDLVKTEERGRLAEALPDAVSQRAKERGRNQLGTLGSGNHFLEIQTVDEIYDDEAAARMGLSEGCVTVMIHCGSRGLGHQVCDDSLKIMRRAMAKYGISVPDRQLVCVPVASPEGREYLGAMRAAANFAMANRHVIADATRRVFKRYFPKEHLAAVWDVSHNLAHMERHRWEGKEISLCVHRKGATRAFAGEPVLIPGSMGTESHVLLGTERAEAETFGSTCHGAGRRMSRKEALKRTDGGKLIRSLSKKGITVMAQSRRTLGEEAPDAYKDVSNVVEVTHRAGISLKVARLRPVAVMKG
ncbi:MAG: RtcB family protein [Synergistota bacterium]|nr:RtcB family protein [Synergistota bacterium]